MSSNSCARNLYLVTDASGIRLGAPLRSSAGFRNFVRLVFVALTAVTLAACAQSSAVTDKYELRAASRQVSLEEKRNAPFVMNRRVAAKTNKHTPFATNKNVSETQVASYGIASFYSDGQQTANGEKFNPNELTAAHRTLPFGTRLRVTSVATGRSVTVRINDRGPFVPGRIVDVSYSAAETLGITGRGIAKVKLDVVQ
jgi:rare lipoprotein A